MHNEEWEDIITPDESISQISQISSETSTLEAGSSVWLYFDKNPSHTPGYNVCKKCSTKYKLTTSVTILRTHLKKHQLRAPIKKHKVIIKRKDPFDDEEQKEHNNQLIQWLICDQQPFTIVDNNYFKKFVNFFCPHYIIPDRHKVKGKVHF